MRNLVSTCSKEIDIRSIPYYLEEALLVRKNKLVSILAVAGLAVATLGFTASTSHAAVFQVRLYVSADTNVENLYLKELIPAFEKS